jgi:hypothetical protein
VTERPRGLAEASSGRPLGLAAFGDAAGDLFLATLFLVTWLAPGSSLALPIATALLTMLLEFIVVHSTGFMGTATLAKETRARRAKAIVGLGVFYSLFVAGFALAFQTWWPLVAFWGLTLNRSLGVMLDPGPTAAHALRIRKSWAAVTMAYLAAVFVTTLLPVPAFGIDRTVVSAAALPASGLWVEQPHRVVAAGFLHFGLCGLSALFAHRWISDRAIPR